MPITPVSPIVMYFIREGEHVLPHPRRQQNRESNAPNFDKLVQREIDKLTLGRKTDVERTVRLDKHIDGSTPEQPKGFVIYRLVKGRIVIIDYGSLPVPREYLALIREEREYKANYLDN